MTKNTVNFSNYVSVYSLSCLLSDSELLVARDAQLSRLKSQCKTARICATVMTSCCCTVSSNYSDKITLSAGIGWRMVDG